MGGLMTKEVIFVTPAFEAAATVYKLASVSEGVMDDVIFARQARRKCMPK